MRVRLPEEGVRKADAPADAARPDEPDRPKARVGRVARRALMTAGCGGECANESSETLTSGGVAGLPSVDRGGPSGEALRWVAGPGSFTLHIPCEIPGDSCISELTNILMSCSNVGGKSHAGQSD